MDDNTEVLPANSDASAEPLPSTDDSPTESGRAPRHGWPVAAIWTTVVLAVLCVLATALLVLSMVSSTRSGDGEGGLAGIFHRTYGEPSSSREARGQLSELARKDLTTALEHAEEGNFSLARDATERAKALLSIVKTLKPKDTPPEVAQVDEVLSSLEKRDFKGYADAKELLAKMLGEGEAAAKKAPSDAKPAATQEAAPDKAETSKPAETPEPAAAAAE